MIIGNTRLQKTTSYRVVLPFYFYAAVAFFAACIMLFFFTDAFHQHHFHPKTLAVTHTMALGWGTMIILGASYQLVPVLIEGKLYSNRLAYASFVLAAVGIPLLVYGFFQFNMGWPVQYGGIFINLSIILYLINLGMSLAGSSSKNIHAVFVFTSMVWLLITTLLGLLLVFNFTIDVLDQNSLRYLSVHAHLGMAGWFLQLVIGVGSRLIPMFMISKYTNNTLLWWIYGLINTGLLLFTVLDLRTFAEVYQIIPAAMLFAAILLFISYCFKAHGQRIRKKLDDPMKISLLSVAMLVLPFVVLLTLVFVVNFISPQGNVALLYGFIIFFGWLTAIILGMTFKTLPFIVWNKVYHKSAHSGQTPNPKDLFSEKVFKGTVVFYFAGFLMFVLGLFYAHDWSLKSGAVLLIVAAFLYNINVMKVIFHKPVSQ